MFWAVSVVGADQAGGTTTFYGATFHTGTSATSSVTVTAVQSGDMVVAAHLSPSNYTSTQGNTDVGFDNNANEWADACNRDMGTATLTYLSGGAAAFVSAGCAIKAA